jgi:peroxiredoxin
MSTPHNAEKVAAINDTIRYTNWTTWKKTGTIVSGAEAKKELQAFVDSLTSQDIDLRGAYDLRGLRADADLMLWIHGPTAEGVQEAIRAFGLTSAGSAFSNTWAGMGLHRPAEFNRSHVPGFMLGAEPRKWLCMYPFVRSYDWYLLPEPERREMLIEHGKAGSVYPQIISSTVASFALGDYEWLLALESDELHDLVDMMRDLRYTSARLHVREEIPFFTGQRFDPTEIGELFQ